MQNENAAAQAVADAAIARQAGLSERAGIEGHFEVECRGSDGRLKWTSGFDNTVVTAGKNAALDAMFAASYAVTGPYMGIISSVSYSAIAAGDTMASHAGWLEAGGTNAPAYSGNRRTCAFAAASAGAKSLSAALSFAMTAGGTIKGCFVVFGAGAVATKDNAAGVLLSAGLFSGGDKPVTNGDTLNVTYTLSL